MHSKSVHVHVLPADLLTVRNSRVHLRNHAGPKEDEVAS